MSGPQTNGGELAVQFGKRLRRWRHVQKLPLKHVANDLGVSVQVFSDWERGVRFPCARNLDQIEGYTGLPLCTFFRGRFRPCPHAPTEMD